MLTFTAYYKNGTEENVSADSYFEALSKAESTARQAGTTVTSVEYQAEEGLL